MLRRPAPSPWAWGFVFLAVLAPVTVGGHDLWVLAGQYRLEPFEATRVFINNGDAFPESLSLLGEHRVTELAVHAPTEKRLISDFRVEGRSLSFEISLANAGSHVIALSTRARRVRLKGEDFTSYIEENGLEHVAALREEAGESERPAVERYTKWAKAMIDVGEAEGASGPDEAAPAWSKPVGHTIEIVPEADPNQLNAGGTLTIRAYYEGEPLVRATVSGGKAGGPAGEILTTTDEDGRATVTILSSGRWYLRTIHMIPHEDDPEVRWESFWCTMTFEVE